MRKRAMRNREEQREREKQREREGHLCGGLTGCVNSPDRAKELSEDGRLERGGAGQSLHGVAKDLRKTCRVRAQDMT